MCTQSGGGTAVRGTISWVVEDECRGRDRVDTRRILGKARGNVNLACVTYLLIVAYSTEVDKFSETSGLSWEQCCLKALLNSSRLNGHTLGFHPQTQKLEPSCTA